MGRPIAGRLVTAGHEVAGYDTAAVPDLDGVRSAGSAGAAAAGAEVVLLCLPDARAVEAVVGGLPEVPLLIDLSSSLPSLTRALGRPLVDAPMSGGVAGAEAGTLTIMAGGDPDLLERARPILEVFSSRIYHAGPAGAGHAVKALNNALSALALAATSEAVATARLAAHAPEATVRRLNAGLGRSQNSEVKFPRDILSGRFASGFTAGLMVKDITTALAMARAGPAAAPVVAVTRERWLAVAAADDFTRIYPALASPVPEPRPLGRLDLDHFDRAVAAACMVGAVEMVRVAEAQGLERARFLDIVNESSGRSEATRHYESGLGLTREQAVHSLDAVRDVAAAGGQPVPVLALAAELVRGGGPWP